MQKQVLIGWKELCARLSLAKNSIETDQSASVVATLKKRSHWQRDRECSHWLRDR
jgi:hypothetical protein